MSFLSSSPLRLALALACAAAIQIPTADAQSGRNRRGGNSDVDITVINRSDAIVNNIFVTAVDDPAWGEDRLGSDTLAAGRRKRFNLEIGRQCRYDMRAVYESGREETRFGVDLCQRSEITLDGRTQTTASDLQRQGPIGLFIVRNRTGNTLQTLKLTSENGDESDDVLGSSVVNDGGTYTGRIRRADGCTYDLLATFDGAEDRTVARRNLCTNREVVMAAERDAPPAGTPAPSGPEVVVEFQNRSAVSMQNLYVRERGRSGWGPDRLGNDTVAARANFTVRMPRGRTCAYDVKVVFDGAPDQVRENVDLCEMREFVVTGPALVTGRGQQKSRPSARSGGEARTLSVSILNEGTNPIESLFVSSSKVSSWGDDMLGTNRIAPGARFQATVERDDQCNYDLRILYTGGREERRMRQNLCDRREVAFGGPNAFRIDGGGPDNGRKVVLTNTGRNDVRELYLTPVTDTHWGDDRLGSETMPRRFRLELRLPNEGGCRWDMKLVYEGGQTIERRDQDLCATPEIAVGRPNRPGQVASTGTGFYITATGHVLTNHHVIDGCSTVAISRPGGQRIPLRLIGADEGADLAVLQQDNTTSQPLSLRGDGATPIRAGERVVLVGYPARSQLGGVNVTEGLVSGMRGALGDQTRFQYTAPTQPGNSGGPVIDASGLVVGVVVSQIDKISGERSAQNINFGIKLDLVRTFLAANGVTAAERAPDGSLPTADILQNSDQSVLPLDCLE
ncbi:trypsin-like peptidase domain-containing protein [Phreatobacter aquaticus]|uniref:Trypsin-like peptidase domain-containing protein n=1 Tax=Phreatobacter aquaticus TaxID=2570229 RepID=A0A4D7QLE5_9HYPH|nr:serine protease [Phreatobacter aquaticus]QCK86184.1 trypsin-like peptidase domain-containing protein [Phreatobacter aquaticus]